MLVESLLLCVSKLNMVFHEVIEELPACFHSGGENQGTEMLVWLTSYNAVDDLFSACIALCCYELLKGPRDGSHCKLLCVSLNVVFLQFFIHSSFLLNVMLI